MKVGFTGTSALELGWEQEVTTGLWLDLLSRKCGAVEAHHGDCVGTDARFHRLARARGIPVVVHPPVNDHKRAHLGLGDSGCLVLAPLPYLDRNKNIVDRVDLLIANPGGPERVRSGTWSTIRYARRLGRAITIIWPDGTWEANRGA